MDLSRRVEPTGTDRRALAAARATAAAAAPAAAVG
jgi:hypothetical protein